MHITNNFISKLKLPNSNIKQKRYYDNNMKGFGVRITSGGIKAFFVEKKINNKYHRITLGRYPYLTVETAKNKAHEFFSKIANGVNPIVEKEETKIKNITLDIAFKDYINARKNLKISTIFVYSRVMRLYFHDWKDKPLMNLTKELISKKTRQNW